MDVDTDKPPAQAIADQGCAASEVSATSCNTDDTELHTYPTKLAALTVQGLKEERQRIENAITALQAIPGMEKAKHSLAAKLGSLEKEQANRRPRGELLAQADAKMRKATAAHTKALQTAARLKQEWQTAEKLASSTAAELATATKELEHLKSTLAAQFSLQQLEQEQQQQLQQERMQQVLHSVGINPHLVPDLATRIATALQEASTPEKSRHAPGNTPLASPGTPPPFALGSSGSWTMDQHQPLQQAMDANAIIEAAKLAAAQEAAEEAALARTAEAAALSKEQHSGQVSAGNTGAPPLPPAHIIEALAAPDSATGAEAAAAAGATPRASAPMEADSCLKRAADETTDDPLAESAAEAKRPREH
eukprot:978712-Amphidinium_carterae.4